MPNYQLLSFVSPFFTVFHRNFHRKGTTFTERFGKLKLVGEKLRDKASRNFIARKAGLKV